MSGGERVVGPDGQGVRLDRWIRRVVGPVPQGRLESLIRRGRIRIDGRVRRAGTRLTAGQRVELPVLACCVERADAVVVPADLAVRIREAVLYRDSDVIVLNKPAGLAVQGGSGTGLRHVDALSVALCEGGQDKPMLVHRLDKETTGVLLLACHRRSAALLARGFASRAIRKLYWAVVAGIPEREAGEISDGGAVTCYRVVDANRSHDVSWLALTPRTGRKHQLRRHMASIGHPVVGDRRYGFGGRVGLGSVGLHLHARRLWLPARADGERVCFEAPVSRLLAESFCCLGFVEEAPEADRWH